MHPWASGQWPQITHIVEEARSGLQLQGKGTTHMGEGIAAAERYSKAGTASTAPSRRRLSGLAQGCRAVSGER